MEYKEIICDNYHEWENYKYKDGAFCFLKKHYQNDQIIEMKRYHLNGKPHREGGPAEILYKDNGKIHKESC